MEQSQHSTKFNGMKQLIAVSLGHFTNDFFVGIIAPISVYFAYKLDLNLTQQGIISIIILIFSSLFQPLFGLIADKKASPKYLILSIVWITVWIGISGIIGNYYILLTVLALGAMASSLYHPLGSTTAVSLGKNSKGTSLSIFMTIGGFAGTVSSIVGLWIAQSYGIEKLIFLIIPGLAVALFMYISSVQNISIEESKTETINKEKSSLTSKSIFWLSILIYICIIKVLSGRFIVTYGIQILTLKNFMSAALLLSAHLFGRPIGTMLGGMLLDRFGQKNVFIFGMFISLVSMSMIAFGNSIISAIGIGSLGFSLSLTNTVIVLLSHNIIPNSQSFATGIIMGIPGGIGSLSMIIFSRIADVNGLIYSSKMLIIPFIIATVLTIVISRKY